MRHSVVSTEIVAVVFEMTMASARYLATASPEAGSKAYPMCIAEWLMCVLWYESLIR